MLASDDQERFLWIGPVRHIGGYGEVARSYLRGLLASGVDLRCVDGHGLGGPAEDISIADIEDLLEQDADADGRCAVYHTCPPDLPRLLETWPCPGAARRVACTICETDHVSPDWVRPLLEFDEVWVPGTFQREVFARCGVPRSRLRIVPYGVDTAVWCSGPVASRETFRFLYSFNFDWRKGFDLLLEAYLHEFRRSDPVELVLKVFDLRPEGNVGADLATSVAQRVNLFDPDLPRVRLLDGPMTRQKLVELYRSTDLYVSCDRANGWGMPCHEAMACGVAAATIDWSGSTEFMHAGNALLIPHGALEDVDSRLSAARPDYAGHHWAAVQPADVRHVLRRAFEDRQTLAGIAQRGQAEVQSAWDLAAAARNVLQRNSRPWLPRPGLVRKVLTSLELPDPQAVLEGARPHISLLTWTWSDPTWEGALRRFCQTPHVAEETSLVLWLDAEGAPPPQVAVDRVHAALEEYGGAPQGSDLFVVVAPHDHIPWNRINQTITSDAADLAAV